MTRINRVSFFSLVPSFACTISILSNTILQHISKWNAHSILLQHHHLSSSTPRTQLHQPRSQDDVKVRRSTDLALDFVSQLWIYVMCFFFARFFMMVSRDTIHTHTQNLIGTKLSHWSFFFALFLFWLLCPHLQPSQLF